MKFVSIPVPDLIEKLADSSGLDVEDFIAWFLEQAAENDEFIRESLNIFAEGS